MSIDETRALREEWLETDGLGGFAMGTAAGVRTRRYHGLLVAALRPPAERCVLVADLEEWIDREGGAVSIASHRYGGGVLHPDGLRRLTSFTHEPWPTWTYAIADGIAVERSIFLPRERAAVCVTYRAIGAPLTLRVRPLLASRDFHALARADDAIRRGVRVEGGRASFRMYDGAPEIVGITDAPYDHEPTVLARSVLAEETARGLDDTEDLYSPGTYSLSIPAGETRAITFAVRVPDGALSSDPRRAEAIARELREGERARRDALSTPLARAADAYLVRRGEGRTIIAGYPWFGDWGRDTFIALRGLCHATGRIDDASAILREWAGAVSLGMLPNRFPDRGEAPEYNSVDASLWYCVAVGEHLALAPRDPANPAMLAAVTAIVRGYAEGTRYGIRADGDGLLACGVRGVQLTWMDAKVGDWVVTPRVGKPVEIQALWIAALAVAAEGDARAAALHDRARASFAARFPDPATGGLYDVVDVDHERGRVDASVRPNQIFAVGGLPIALLEGDAARRVVDLVEARLATPLGLRSLDPADRAYRARYEGGVLERDGSYHQGTVWPWLAGAFVDAWLRVRGRTSDARREAEARFVAPLRAHLGEGGLGHVSEIADAEPPHTPRGCPFQAWSVGELVRLEQLVRR